MVPTFSIAKSFEESCVPTGKVADLSFTSFLDVRGHGLVKHNRRARAEREVSWKTHKVGWIGIDSQSGGKT